MLFSTKIAVVVREDLAPWQKLNVVAFLAGGLVGAAPELAGQAYRDASGQVYGPLIRQPILIFGGNTDALTRTLARSRQRGVVPAIYTQALFGTGNDDDNRAAVEAVATDSLDLVGIALHADRKDVDKITKGLSLHG